MQEVSAENTIVRLTRSEHDKRAIDAAGGVPPWGNQWGGDYSNKVVQKPWGYEYLIFSSPSVGVWVLFLKGGHSTSMHCHSYKSTSLAVLQGSVNCATLAGSYGREPGQGMYFGKNVFHKTTAVSDGGAFVLEVESPPAKHDLMRLDDFYGRAGVGYEGADKHVGMPKGISTLAFNADGVELPCSRDYGEAVLEIVSICDDTASLRLGTLANYDLVYMLEGRVCRSDGMLLMLPGDCQTANLLRSTPLRWEPQSTVAFVRMKRASGNDMKNDPDTIGSGTMIVSNSTSSSTPNAANHGYGICAMD